MKEVLCERPSVETGVGLLRQENKFTLLDCFCGMGGTSDGFSMEGFDVTGIDIVDAPKMLGYKHRFIQADMLSLKGEDFKGYDVIWGSPPCREFTSCVEPFSHRWKKPPNLQEGLALVNSYLWFIQSAKPGIWIMENHPNLKKHVIYRSRFTGKLSNGMRRSFWGNFPIFMLPSSNKKSIWKGKYNNKTRSWERAKIPLACSRAFAKACHEALLEKETCP
jgi:site-specific DNA-cytosine methylase